MPRRERLSAGDIVRLRVERLSDELLAEEHAVFAQFEFQFAERYPNALRLVQAAYRKGLAAEVRNGRMVEKCQLVVEDAVEACTEAVGGLLERASVMVMDSLADELTACESTLSKKYEGVAARAVAEVTGKSGAVQAAALDQFRTEAVRSVMFWRTDWEDAIRYAVMMGEEMGVLEKRLFSTDRVRLPGHSGRGVWWRVTGSMSRFAREVEFQSVNDLRTLAMSRMNVAANARR